ncbi:MAG: hypothetical protein HEP71_26960 [Roseivirga sp.]|nr:hypothetical protein [Roseivirga sp.]
MLYIKFDIQDSSKFMAFEKLYAHMVKVRQPGFEFEEEEVPEFDWDNMTPEEVDKGVKELHSLLDEDEQELKRYKELIPDYANAFLKRYLQVDNDKAGVLGMLETLSILNYLEYGFEVDMDNLDKIDESSGQVEFSTGNYPYGGMERFLMVLKAFGLMSTECYNGFTVYEFDWASDFEHEAIELPEKTKAYLAKMKAKSTK